MERLHRTNKRENQALSIDDFYIGDIPEYPEWVEISRISDGSGHDPPYLFFVRDEHRQDKALFLFPHGSFDYHRQAVYYYEKVHLALQRSTSRRIEKAKISYGSCNRGQCFYQIVPWMHDRPFLLNVKDIQVEELHEFAFSAISCLKALHHLPLVRSIASDDWSGRYIHQSRSILKAARYQYPELATLKHFSKFFESNIRMVSRRPVCPILGNFTPEAWYVHEDFKMVTPTLCDLQHGDPWYDFRYLPISIHPLHAQLAICLIDYYFNFAPPDEFFICMVIYSVTSLLKCLIGTSMEDHEKRQQLVKLLRSIDHDHAKFVHAIPEWYKPLKHAYLSPNKKLL